MKIEESFAGIAGLLIVGTGDERVNVLAVLWLAAVASGVLARGGRVHWIGRAVLLSVLVMPIVVNGRITPEHAGLCIAAIGLLLTCGRVTRELNHLLAHARHEADHDGLTGALSRSAFRAVLDSLENANRAGDAALLLIDLDNFGQTNKQSGHAAGDALLASTVVALREVLGADVPDRPPGRRRVRRARAGNRAGAAGPQGAEPAARGAAGACPRRWASRTLPATAATRRGSCAPPTSRCAWPSAAASSRYRPSRESRSATRARRERAARSRG